MKKLFLLSMFALMSAVTLFSQQPELPNLGKIVDATEDIFAKETPWQRLTSVAVYADTTQETAVVELQFDSVTVVNGETLIGHMGETSVEIGLSGGKNTVVTFQRENSYELSFPTKDMPGLGAKDSVTVAGIWKTRLSEKPAFLTFAADSTAQSKGKRLAEDTGDALKEGFTAGKEAATEMLKVIGVVKGADQVLDWDDLSQIVLTASSYESLSFDLEHLLTGSEGEKVILTYRASNGQHLVIHALRDGNNLNAWFGFCGKTEADVVEMDELLLASSVMMTADTKGMNRIRKKGGVVDFSVPEIPESLRSGLTIAEAQDITVKLNFE